MQRLHIAALIAALAVIPVGAGVLFADSKTLPCLSVGGAQYKMTSDAHADFRIRVMPETTPADFRIQFVDTPETADFVLIDDGDTATCASSARSIRADTAEGKADMTVSASETAGDYKLYVRSAAFSRQQAAALFAVIWRTPRQRIAAQP